MILHPTAEECIAEAERLYEEIRDLSKFDATRIITFALMDARAASANAVLDDLAARTCALTEVAKP